MQETLKLTFASIIYEGRNQYCIYKYGSDKKEDIICVGTALPKLKKIKYEMFGEWKETAKYGKNFYVKSFQTFVEDNETSIVEYLSSGFIKGIGKATAKKIWKEFGSSCLDVISKEPLRLTVIPRISSEKAKEISKCYNDNICVMNISSFISKYGIPTKHASEICNKLKYDTVEKITSNPYSLYNIKGISLDSVDAISADFKFPKDDISRICAHAKHVMNEVENEGSTGIRADEFGLRLINSLNTNLINTSNIRDVTIELIKKGILQNKVLPDVNRNLYTYIFKAYTYKIEQSFAERIIELNNAEPVAKERKMEILHNILDKLKEKNLCPDDEQLSAIQMSIDNNVSVITGGPGTGKTTIIKVLADYFAEILGSDKIVFMAPSGRAARRITESTGYDAFTIHSGLMLRPDDLYERDMLPEDMYFDKVFFIDEFSMTDIFLAEYLVYYIGKGCRCIFIGDVNQLPSVGPGAVLRDLIESGVVAVSKLNHIHRQDEDSQIYINSKKITDGNSELLEGKDFKFVVSRTAEEAEEKMLKNYCSYAKQYGVKNIYCLCPIKNGFCGTIRMNALLQERLNPLHPGDEEFVIGETKYRIGDPVMQLKNEAEVANGDIGYVEAIEYDNKDECMKMYVTFFGDTEKVYTKDDADSITLAYAFTVHKAQGSENKITLTFISKTLGKKMLKRSLVNTAVSRAKTYEEIFLTDDNALQVAIANDDSKIRITSTKYHLQYYAGKMVCAG